MTIYRLNRVPDKLHVALLELLGIQLDGPSAARDRPALPARRAADRAGADPRRRDRGRHAAHRAARSRSSSRSTRTSRSRAARPAAYVLQRGGQIKDVGVADGEARPQGADQLPFGNPPAVGDALYLGFDEPIGRLLIAGRRRRLAGARRGRRPRGPAAALGGLPGRQRLGGGGGPRGPHRRLQLRRRHGRAAAAAALGGRSRSAATACTGCAAGSTTRRATAAPRRPTRSRPRSTRSRAAPIGALLPALARRAGGERGRSASSDGTPGQVFPLRYNPVLKPGDGRDARGPGPRVGRLGGVGAARRTSSPRPSSTATSSSTRSRGEVELGPAIRETDGGWTQYGAVPPKGALLRFTRYRHGGGRRGNVAAGALTVLRTHDPRRRHGHQPGAGHRRRRPRGARARAPARGDGDPHALPRGHGRGLRVPRRRGVAARRARGLRAAAGHGRPGRAAPRAAALPRRPPARLRRARARRGAARRRSPSTSTSAA